MAERDEAFLQECRSVARCFLYLSIDKVVETRSPDGPRKPDSVKKVLTEQSPQALAAGMRLRELGDRINDQIKAAMEEALKDLWRNRSVWEVGRTEFSRLCERVYASCQGAVQNSWAGVWVVYSFMERLVGEVRQQEGAQQSGADSDTRSRDPIQLDTGPEDQAPSLRERNLQDFAVDFMRGSGQQEWIEQHGGMKNFGN